MHDIFRYLIFVPLFLRKKVNKFWIERLRIFLEIIRYEVIRVNILSFKVSFFILWDIYHEIYEKFK